MSKINKIKVSGTSYDLEDKNAAKSVTLTQAEYDALVSAGTVDQNTFYVISDATPGDLSQYWTSAETQSAITQATSGKASQSDVETVSGQVANKQDTLVSGTNIKTINNESILGSGNITIQGGGGSVTIDPSLDSGSTNAVANSAITTAFNSCLTVGTYWDMVGTPRKNVPLRLKRYGISGYNDIKIDLGSNLVYGSEGTQTLSVSGVVETSAITTSVTSSSTDAQVPSAKAVNDKLGGLSLVKLTQNEYDALATKDNSTLYVIVN